MTFIRRAIFLRFCLLLVCSLDFEFAHHLFQIDFAHQIADPFALHLGDKSIITIFLLPLRDIPFRSGLLLRHRCIAGLNDDIVLIIKKSARDFARHIQNEAEPAGRTLEKPDMRYRNRKVNMPMRSRRTRESVISTPHRSQITPLCLMRLYFHKLHSIPVGPKMRSQNNPPFRLVGPIVDRLRILHLAMAPRPDNLRRSQGDF